LTKKKELQKLRINILFSNVLNVRKTTSQPQKILALFIHKTPVKPRKYQKHPTKILLAPEMNISALKKSLAQVNLL